MITKHLWQIIWLICFPVFLNGCSVSEPSSEDQALGAGHGRENVTSPLTSREAKQALLLCLRESDRDFLHGIAEDLAKVANEDLIAYQGMTYQLRVFLKSRRFIITVRNRVQRFVYQGEFTQERSGRWRAVITSEEETWKD